MIRTNVTIFLVLINVHSTVNQMFAFQILSFALKRLIVSVMCTKSAHIEHAVAMNTIVHLANVFMDTNVMVRWTVKTEAMWPTAKISGVLLISLLSVALGRVCGNKYPMDIQIAKTLMIKPFTVMTFVSLSVNSIAHLGNAFTKVLSVTGSKTVEVEAMR